MSTAPRGKVLVIDDDPLVTATYEAHLEVADFAVETAPNAAAGFAALRAFNPDVVLLDLRMPVTSGLDWLGELRKIPEYQKLPVFILTSSPADSREAAAAMESGAAGVMTKSQWDPEAVATALRWALVKSGALADETQQLDLQ